jgi:hypothetical protein
VPRSAWHPRVAGRFGGEGVSRIVEKTFLAAITPGATLTPWREPVPNERKSREGRIHSIGSRSRYDMRTPDRASATRPYAIRPSAIRPSATHPQRTKTPVPVSDMPPFGISWFSDALVSLVVEKKSPKRLSGGGRFILDFGLVILD